MNSLQISNWSDLEAAAGIKPLTGEACKYSQRLLCDVNADGLVLLAEFLGVPQLTLEDPYNSTVNSKPSVGSIMLARSMWEPLAEFVLAQMNALAILYVENRVSAGLFSQDYVERYAALGSPSHDIRRLPGASLAPSVGSRNVHAATGRVH
jgi:hypothetical protein